VEAHRGLAYALDDGEHRLALLLAHGIAEDAAEQADVIAQWQVLVGDVAVVENGHGHLARELLRCRSRNAQSRALTVYLSTAPHDELDRHAVAR
jgi:hypothetical protein